MFFIGVALSDLDQCVLGQATRDRIVGGDTHLPAFRYNIRAGSPV